MHIGLCTKLHTAPSYLVHRFTHVHYTPGNKGMRRTLMWLSFCSYLTALRWMYVAAVTLSTAWPPPFVLGELLDANGIADEREHKPVPEFYVLLLFLSARKKKRGGPLDFLSALSGEMWKDCWDPIVMSAMKWGLSLRVSAMEQWDQLPR